MQELEAAMRKVLLVLALVLPLVFLGMTDQVFTHPAEKQTEDYVTGKFG